MAHKTGDYIGSGKNRKQWNGRRWVPRPVSTPAAGRNAAPGTGRSRAARSRTAPVTPSKSSYIPADKRPADMQKGKIYGDKTAATGRNWTNGYGAESSKPSTGNHRSAVAPPAPKLPPAPKKATPTKPNASTYKKHKSDLHIGRYKTLKEHRAAVAAAKRKKKPDSSQIRAMSK